MPKPLYIGSFVLALAVAYASGQVSTTTAPTGSTPGSQAQGTTAGQTGHEGSAAHSGMGQSGQVNSAAPSGPRSTADEKLHKDVHKALKKDGDASLAKVMVDVRSGVARLFGSVDTEAHKARAEEIARAVQGVTSVRNELAVGSSAAMGAGAGMGAGTNGVGNSAGMTSGSTSGATSSASATPSGTGSTTTTAGAITGAGTASSTPDPNASSATGSGSAGVDTDNPSGATSDATVGSGTNTTGAANAAGTSASTDAAGTSGNTGTAATSTTPNTTAASTSSTGTAGSTSAGVGSTDAMAADLESRIEQALRNEPTLRTSTLDVVVSATSIDLSGSVPTGKEKQTAKRIAESYASNRKVNDRLTVSGRGNAGSGSAGVDNDDPNKKNDKPNPPPGATTPR